MARVSKSMGPRLDERSPDEPSAEPARELPQRTLDRVRTAFPPRAEDAQFACLPVVERLDTPDDVLAAENRQDVVPVLALRLRDVHLEAVEEVPEGKCAVPVVDQAVERRQEGDARSRYRAVGGVGVREEPSPAQLDAQRPEPLVLEPALRLRPRDSLGLRVPALGEVPETLPAPAPDDGNLAYGVQHAQHQPHLALAPPAVGLAARRPVILDLPRE